MSARSRKEEVKYRKLRKLQPDSGDKCRFCTISAGHTEFIEGSKYFKVITNRFKYSYWDEQDVEHQVMLVPKIHTESISKLPLAAATEFLKYIGKYESEGYSIWARATQSPTKTISHQHTHMIKTNGKRKRIMIYNRKPYMLFIK